MSYSPQTIIGERLINDDLPWLITDDTAAWFFDAVGALFQQTQVIIEDQSTDGLPDYQTGYGTIFTVNPRFVGDTAICPTDQLPYLGQFGGVPLPPDADDAAARSLISAEAGLQRGTLAAIIAAAQRFLSGTQSVVIYERTASDGTTPDPYHFVLVVFTSEVIDAAGLTAAVNAVKPGGVLWTLIETTGWIITEMEVSQTTLTALETAFISIDHLERDIT